MLQTFWTTFVTLVDWLL